MDTKRAGAFALLLWASIAVAQSRGDRVLAERPEDGLWYPARVAKVAGADVHVRYDDGRTGVVHAGQFGPVDWAAGTILQCDRDDRGTYAVGVVESIDGERLAFRYDDGGRESTTIGRCRGLPR